MCVIPQVVIHVLHELPLKELVVYAIDQLKLLLCLGWDRVRIRQPMLLARLLDVSKHLKHAMGIVDPEECNV
jgi:hypothetical protein